MTANDDLMDWNTHWRISDGVVTCRTCHSQQPEIDRACAFAHCAGCGLASQARNPWDDLDSIRKKFGDTP